MARGEQFRPEVEALTDRLVPASVVQRFDGVIDIDGGFFSDDVHVFYDRFGNVVVNDRGFIDVFDGATVTGIEFYGYRGNDRFVNDTAIACYANGGVGHDYLEGGDGDDVLVGGFGNDVLVGNYGADGLYGGFGRDTLWADYAADVFPGGQFGDRVFWD
jgi:Ca2+-binding RTX toxin-like protein